MENRQASCKLLSVTAALLLAAACFVAFSGVTSSGTSTSTSTSLSAKDCTASARFKSALAALHAAIPSEQILTASSEVHESLGEIPRGKYSYVKEAQQWDPAYDLKTPTVIVVCLTESEVSHAVRFASKSGLPVRVKSGGHQVLGWSVCKSGCVVIDLYHMDKIEVSAEAKSMVVQSGAKQRQIYEQLSRAGLATTLASGGSISMGGLVHSGGFGFANRLYGMMCDNVVSARAVLADGSIAELTADSHGELLWAIKGGGGGQFAVVTSFTFKLFDLPHSSQVGTLTIKGYNLTKAFNGYVNWLDAAPDGFQPFISPVAGLDPALNVKLFYHASSADSTEMRSSLTDLARLTTGNLTLADVWSEQMNSPAEFWDVYKSWITAYDESVPEDKQDQREYMSLLGFQTGRADAALFAENLEQILELIAARSQCCKAVSPQAMKCGMSALTSGTGKMDRPDTPNAYGHRANPLNFMMSSGTFKSSQALSKLGLDGYGVTRSQNITEQFTRVVECTHNALLKITKILRPSSAYIGSPTPHDLQQYVTNPSDIYYGQHTPKLAKVKQQYDPHNLFSQPQNVLPERLSKGCTTVY